MVIDDKHIDLDCIDCHGKGLGRLKTCGDCHEEDMQTFPPPEGESEGEGEDEKENIEDKSKDDGKKEK